MEDTNNGVYHAGETKTRYELSAGEQQHIADVKSQCDAINRDVMQLRGALYDKQNELEGLRRHLSLYIGAIAANAGLPPTGAVLLADGKTLTLRG